MLTKLKLNRFKDTQFANLMTKRIFNVLLVANPYDAFMLEDDGRIDEKIFIEYMNLSLRYPPRFTQVSTEEDTWRQLGNTMFDLVICMPGSDNSDTFDIGRQIKEKYPHIPLVVLTPFSHGIRARMEHEDLSIFEYVFCWLGNTDLLLSIIKLIEDKMNLEHDINEVGVQMILLVEDSIRFYSSVLPNLYKFVLTQSQEFATEALNEHQRTLRMRGRPKIVLARSYEEAMDLYERFKNNILGIISDARFPREGAVDPLAGIKLLGEIRKSDPYMPLILQSAEESNRAYASRLEASFIDKNSKKMNIDLRDAVSRNFGFGDFIFINPRTMEEVARVHNLKELQNVIFNYFNALKIAYENAQLWYNKTVNPFFTNAGFTAAIDVLNRVLIAKCAADKDFTQASFVKHLKLDATLLQRSDIKNKDGKSQRKAIAEFLEESINQDLPTEDGYKF